MVANGANANGPASAPAIANSQLEHHNAGGACKAAGAGGCAHLQRSCPKQRARTGVVYAASRDAFSR
jgi:hypothetical protein